jgi:immunity protein 7 of polymorphic toxin system
MIHYHAWATIRWRENQEQLGGAAKLLADLKRKIEPSGSFPPIVGMQYVNGELLFWAAGSRNHRGKEFDALLALYRDLSMVAPLSFGLIYVWDDEDSRGFGNEFRVWRLARGEVQELKDVYLSPCVPVIDEPEA